MVYLSLLFDVVVARAAVSAGHVEGPPPLQLRLHHESLSLLLGCPLLILLGHGRRYLVFLAEYVATSRLDLYDFVRVWAASNIDTDARMTRRVLLEVAGLLAAFSAQVPGLVATHESADAAVAARCLLGLVVSAATESIRRIRRGGRWLVLRLLLLARSLLITVRQNDQMIAPDGRFLVQEHEILTWLLFNGGKLLCKVFVEIANKLVDEMHE